MNTKAEILNPEDDSMFKDGLENLVASLGSENDKRHNSEFVNRKRLSLEGNQEELNALYRTEWLAGKVIDIIPNDMTREWRTFKSDKLTPEDKKRLEEEEERLNVTEAFNEAHKWARLYGTAFIILAIADGKNPDEELIIDDIKPGMLKHIKVVDRHRVTRGDVVEENPLKTDFGYPVQYRLNNTSVVIHASRVIRFDGVKLPFDEFRRNGYWSDSILDRLYEAITNFDTASNSAASMIYETNVDIVKVKGFMNYLATDEGEKLLRKRFALAKALKSFNNMLLMDSEEEHQTKSNSFSGLPDLIDKFAHALAAATDIPATRLLGDSASGLSATGEGDLKNYYDMIRSLQKNVYKPKLRLFDRIMSRNIGIDDDEKLTFEFDSLFQLTSQEKADVALKNSQRDDVYLTNEVIKRSAVAKQLKDDETYSNISKEDIDELEEEEENANIGGGFGNIDTKEEEEAEEISVNSNPEKRGSEISESSAKPNS